VGIRRPSSLHLTAEGVVCGILVSSIRIFRQPSTLFPSLIIQSIFFGLRPSIQKPHLLNHGNNYLRKTLGRLNTSRGQKFLQKLTIPLIAQKFCPVYAARNSLPSSKIPSSTHILNQINPVHVFPSYFLRSMVISSSHLRLSLPIMLSRYMGTRNM
jgi:hypothetical protein